MQCCRGGERCILCKQKTAYDVRISDWSSDVCSSDLSPFDLLGLYRGGSLTAEMRGDTGTLPAMIFLYRRPLLDYWCETGESLRRVVRHVLIHEIGHHLGLSDDDKIGRASCRARVCQSV